MNKEILKTDVQDFIRNNFNTDILSVSLKKSPFPNITSKELAQQLSGRHKASVKLPSWHKTQGIYYPPGLNLEQTSSEETARYKASLVRGETLVDLTGGLGVDAYFFSRVIHRVHYCELDVALAEIAAHNFAQLGAENIVVHKGNGIELLKEIRSTGPSPDWIYMDPSRRKADRTKVFRLEDCAPPVLEVLPGLLQSSSNVLIKTSPLLDLSQGIRQLGSVREVHVVGVRNEVRELLWWVQDGHEQPPVLVAVDLKHKEDALRFTMEDEARSIPTNSMPLSYLYEPNAPILKAGGFKIVAREFGLHKLHPHTHLYTSDDLIPFPGRRFRVRQMLPYKPGKLPYKKANVSSRNFPETVAQIRKRNRIADGGKTYLFFVRCMDESLKVLEGEPV